MRETAPPGPAPSPPPDLHARSLKTTRLQANKVLYRIHRTSRKPLHFGRHTDPARRQRWDAPDGSYGVCYMAKDGHIAFAETLLRDLSIRELSEAELDLRSLCTIRVVSPLRLVTMHGGSMRAHGADPSVVHGPYPKAWEWSLAFHEHPSSPDGILYRLYRARHDDSGLSIALFERARGKVEKAESIRLLDSGFAETLGEWLDRYDLGLSS